jgi:hypothetical protein
MHEAGHAAHFANVTQESPLFSQERAPTSIAYAETQAMFLDSLVSDASWRCRYALNASGERLPFELHENDLRSRHPYQVFQLRALLAVPYFEKALYEHADLTPSTIIELADQVEQDIVGGLAARPLLSVPHILRDESSCYYHGYVLAEMAVQQTRKHFGSSIVDNPAVGEALTQTYWRPGNTANFMDLVEKLTHEPLSGNAWVDSLNRDIDSLIESERRAYDDAIVTRDDVDLDMRIRIVDGDNIIADSAECGSFLATCRRFEAYLEKRYGDGMDRGHMTTETIVQEEITPVEEPRRKRSAAIAWGLDRPDKASVIITKVGYDMVESFHIPMTEGDTLEQGGRIKGSTVSSVKPFRAYKRPKPTDRTEWSRWNNDQELLIGRGEDTSPEEWRFKFAWRGCDFVVAGPSCLDRRRKKFQEDSEKKRLRSLPKRIRTLGDAATDAFLNGDIQRAADLRTVRASLVEEHASLKEKHPSDKLLKKLKAINARIDMVAAPIGGAVKGGYVDQACFCGRSLLPLFDERDKLEGQLAERLGLKRRIPELRDRTGLEARMASDGWTTEESTREDNGRVDRFYLSPSGGKRLRSILEVARHAYPEFLVEPVKSSEEGGPALWHGRAGPVVPLAAPAVPQGGRVRKQPRLQTGPAPAQLRLATRQGGVALGPASNALPAWREAGLLRTAGAYNPLVRLPKSVLPKSLFPSVELPPSKWRPGMRVVVPARAFGEEWALENPGDYPGTIVELDEECAAGRTWLVDYEDGPTSTDEAFFVEAPSPMEEDEASEAPAAPPDPAYQDLPLCRDEGEALLRGALQDLMEM